MIAVGMSFVMIYFIAISKAKDLPCNAVRKEAGFVCVCNSTYCDTVETPRKLGEREFHVYSTSNNKPGFNHYTGFFRIQSFAPHGIKFKVNDNRKKQKIRGFGSSFTDSFGFTFNKLSTKTQDNFLKSHFSSDGFEYSLCRLVLGSSDFSLRDYTYVPNYDPSLRSFNLTKEDYEYKIWIIRRANAMSKRTINLLGSTWSPPSWMKRNNSPSSNYIYPKFRQAWAEYHVRTLDAFRKEGVNMWGLTTGNEPITLMSIKVPIPNLVMLPEEQREWIAENLGPALDKAGYKNISIILLDDQRKYIYWWMDTVMRSKTARKYVKGIGMHWYMDSVTSPLLMDKLIKKYPNQELLYTESSINPAVNKVFFDRNRKNRDFVVIHPSLGSWKRALLYSSSIIENLLHWVNGYIDWNLALDTNGGPNISNFTCDAPVIINETADEFYKQPMFYTMGHFSKFLQPGAVIIDVDIVGDRKELKEETNKLSSFQRKDTIIFPPSFTFKNVQPIGAKNPDGSHTVIILNPKIVPVDISVYCPTKGYAFLELQPESITTLLY